MEVSSALTRRFEAIWRIESPKLIASLARIVRDIGRAEELAQDAFVAALVQWPDEGIPRNPGAWLMTAAKRRAIDSIRRDKTLERKTEVLVREIETQIASSETFELGGINDDMLGLMFVALPSAPLDRDTRRAYAAPARGAHDRGNRARVPEGCRSLCGRRRRHVIDRHVDGLGTRGPPGFNDGAAGDRAIRSASVEGKERSMSRPVSALILIDEAKPRWIQPPKEGESA